MAFKKESLDIDALFKRINEKDEEIGELFAVIIAMHNSLGKATANGLHKIHENFCILDAKVEQLQDKKPKDDNLH